MDGFTVRVYHAGRQGPRERGGKYGDGGEEGQGARRLHACMSDQAVGTRGRGDQGSVIGSFPF